MEEEKATSPPIHRLKLSIDVRSIKDQDFLGQIYFKYAALPTLNINQWRNSPTLAITNAKVEQQFPNGFNSYSFEASGRDLADRMSQALEVEVWHSDRLRKDVMLGICKVDIKEVMNMPLRKTRESYARVLDGYFPLDAVDEGRNPQKKIGALRILIYLEDLGPVALLKQNEEKYGLKPAQEIDLQPRQFDEPDQRQVQPDNNRQAQLNELEYKVVWELQTWKKAEEAKTKILLKQRQVQFWSQLAEEQKRKDLEKQKYFKKIEANLTLIEGKLKAKAGELQKRQQKLVLLQQELQTKISQVSRQLLAKDEQIEQLKKKNKEDRLNMNKQKAAIELQHQKLRNDITKLKLQLEQSQKEDEKSPVFLIKTQLNAKYLQIKELTRQYQKAIETKEQYRIYYEKMKNQFMKVKAENQKKHENFESLKLQNELLKEKMRCLQQQMVSMQQQYTYPMVSQPSQNPSVPEQSFSSEKQRLRYQRQQLIDTGAYSSSDPLIKQYDKLIGAS